jgi:serine/threonine protein kinase
MGSAGHASLIGQTFAGYEVQALLGRGAMSCVYQAQDVRLGRPVALKVLLGSLARNPVNVRLFHREAQAAAPLRHANIVRVYSAGVEAHTPYIAMEYVPGESLARFLRRKGVQKWQTALYIGEQVAAALECAHEHGITHRDVKPANILLDQNGRVRLTDFGIACAQQAGDDQMAAGVLGTPHYMAPELCSGEDASSASDLYALGVTLYELMAGELPFESDSPVVLLKQIATEEPVRLNRKQRDLPDDVARLVAHLLTKDPVDRPKDANEVRERIAQLMNNGGGRSAIPDALASFVKEQSRASNLRVLTPPPKNSVRKRNTKKRARPQVGLPNRERLGRMAAAGCAVLLCLFVGLWIGSGGGAEASLRPAPELTSARFDPIGGEMLLMQTPIEAYRFTDIRWLGDRSTVVVTATGLPGTLFDGFTGVMSVDPATQTCTNVIAPRDPISGDTLLQGALSPMPAYAPISSLDGMFPVYARTTEGDSSRILTRLVRVDDGLLLRKPILTISGLHNDTKRRDDQSASTPESMVPFTAPHPDGDRVCVALHDSLHRGYYLVELPVPFEGSPEDGTRLTTTDARLDPESVAYSPDGSRIGYLLKNSKEQTELWVLQANGQDMNGRPIAADITDQMFAFSPDSDLVLLSQYVEGEPTPHALAVSASDGVLVHDLGVGQVGHEAWDPSGAFVVVAAPDSRGQDQVWAVENAPPFRRQQLTTLENGIGGTPAVSRDGAWVAAFGNTDRASLVFVDVSTVDFDGADHA